MAAALLVVAALPLVGQQAAQASPAPAPPAPVTRVSSDPVAYAKALTSPDWVKTPHGLMNKSCVHPVPDGATVEGDTFVLASGARQSVPQCAYPRLEKPQSGSATPATNGWMITTWWDSPTWLRRLYVNYAVPTAPSVVGATNFFFSSFEPSDGTAIVQPVLTFGGSASGGGNYWYITAWYVWGNNSYYGSNVKVNPLDTIWGAMEANSCDSSGGHCHWAIRVVDQTIGGESRIDIESDSIYTTAQGGVLESYGASGCVMLPANHHGVFRNIQVFGPTFNLLTPSWYVWQPDPECSMYETYSTTSADILWTS